MKPYHSSAPQRLIGRKEELLRLDRWQRETRPYILVVYGRRRIGKTTLIEHFFDQHRMFKFEGIQPAEPPRGKKNVIADQKKQIDAAFRQLARYLETEREKELYSQTVVNSWTSFFELFNVLLGQRKAVLYFEEIQWLASYSGTFCAELKEAWDNLLQRNHELVVVLCGSSTSFVMRQVLSNKALYNRSMEEIKLRPFDPRETSEFLGKERSSFEVMDAQLTVGGIPEYLKRLKNQSSVYLGLCQNTFVPDSFFMREKEKIFVSSLSKDRYYERIVAFLAQRKFATRAEIQRNLKTTTGFHLTETLLDLEQCDFVEKYSPVQLPANSKAVRYRISDPYLRFYYKFVEGHKQDIQKGLYQKNPATVIVQQDYRKWLGFAFERWCCQHHRIIARLLGFEAVSYRAGAFFNRRILSDKTGFQIDLVFIRKDCVITICEIKYHEMAVGVKVIETVENKIEKLKEEFVPARQYSIQKVLIASFGGDASLLKRHYFDRIITLDELISED